MDSVRAAALERILEALIEAGEGEAFMAVAKRIEAMEQRKVRISVEPLIEAEPSFTQAVEPMRFRRA